MKKIFYLLPIYLFLFIFHTAEPAYSQGFSLSISPPLIEITTPPGKSTIYALEVENHSPSPVIVKAEIIPFKPQGEKGYIKLDAKEKSPSLSWFSLINTQIQLNKPFLIPPSQKQQLVLRIAPPQNAPQGDYYQTLLIKQIATRQSPQGNNSYTLGAIGTNILISVNANSPEKKAVIKEFSIKNPVFKNYFDSLSSLRFTLRIKNEGKSFFKPVGTIKILPDNQELTLRPDNVLSQSTRQIQCEKGPCQFKPQKTFGRYQAILKFNLDKDTSQTYQEKLTFFVLPFRLIAISLTALAIILLLVRKMKIKKNKS